MTVSTKDGVLIVRHEPDLTNTTNVKSLAQYASRKRTVIIDGVSYTGWFASDFTLAEIKRLRAVQSRGGRTTRLDNAFEVPTLQEVIDLAGRCRRRCRVLRGRCIVDRNLRCGDGADRPPAHHHDRGRVRYVGSAATSSSLVAAGWTRLGVGFCAAA